jgi:ATP-dependent RNA helicase DDX31/DBP7
MTEIQKLSIPVQLENAKVLVKSETGSGKTLAYLVPMVDYFAKLSLKEKITRD